MNHTVTIELSLDFKALAKQKLNLLTARNELTLTKSEMDDYDSIINMIDSIQDQAAKQISEAQVFGPNF